MRRAGYLFSVGLVCCLSIYALFYWQINSHLGLIFGDELDTIIQATLISHWYGVFMHGEVWNAPLYFYPHTDVLGYNDGYLLNGFVATAFRLAGFNYLASNELCLMVFRAIGFLSMVALLNRLQQQPWINIAGAALFTLAINVPNQAGHGQLFSVSFAPLLALLLLNVVRAVENMRRWPAFLWASAFFVLFNALLLTSFYMAWFFGLFLILFAIAKALADFGAVKAFVLRLVDMKAAVIGALIVFGIMVIPFLYVYLPTLRATGGQDYGGQILYSLRPYEIFNTGNASFVWGGLFDYLSHNFGFTFRRGEYRSGFTPDVVIGLMIVIAAVVWKRACFPKTFVALVLATSVGLLLPISVYSHSLWYFVNYAIPGASGMRVVARFYLFLTFPIAIMFAMFAERAIEMMPSIKGIVVGVLLLLCISQIMREPETRLNAAEQIQRLAAIPAPPATCRSFFAMNPSIRGTLIDRKYRQNVEAMAIAEHFEIPTINGIASFQTADWAFEDSPSYLQNVGLYIEGNKLEGVCSLDLSERKWEIADLAKLYRAALNYQSASEMKLSDPHAQQALALGWSSVEPWGVWSDGPYSVLLLSAPKNLNGDLKLTIDAQAFIAGSHDRQEVTVQANGQDVGKFYYGGTQPVTGTRSVVIPKSAALARNGLIVVKLTYADPASPYDLKISEDHRKLGIGLTSIRLEVK